MARQLPALTLTPALAGMEGARAWFPHPGRPTTGRMITGQGVCRTTVRAAGGAHGAGRTATLRLPGQPARAVGGPASRERIRVLANRSEEGNFICGSVWHVSFVPPPGTFGRDRRTSLTTGSCREGDTVRPGTFARIRASARPVRFTPGSFLGRIRAFLRGWCRRLHNSGAGGKGNGASRRALRSAMPPTPPAGPAAPPRPRQATGLWRQSPRAVTAPTGPATARWLS